MPAHLKVKTVLSHFGPLKDPSCHAKFTGPCGDTMEFWVRLSDGRISAIGFTTDGCGMSQACGDMTACLAEGLRVEELEGLTASEILTALGPVPEEESHCAVLALTTLRLACKNLGKKEG